MSSDPLTSQNVVAWHGRTPAEHKALLDKWAALGFRGLSLSLYGDPQNPLYAAVMIKRVNVIAAREFGPVSQAGIQQVFNDMAKTGYGPYLLAATGPRDSAVFAAVFTPMSGIPLTRLNLSHADFVAENAARHAAGDILIWIDAFGTDQDPRFAAIWGPNASHQAWSIDSWSTAENAQDFVEDPAMLQIRFDTLTSTWCRPAHITVAPAGCSLELFVDSTIGGWVSRAQMTAADYQAEFDKQAAAGRMPLQVSAHGAGADARFAAIFTSREDSDPFVFRSQGPVTVTGIDAVMESFVKSENLRGAALAIAKGTQLVYAKGYTNAEVGVVYPDITPTTLFRQASVSKVFTGTAMWRLFQLHPNITLDMTVQSIMNLKQPDGSAPHDARFAKITIRHLLESDSGIPQWLSYASVEAAQAFQSNLPAKADQLLSYATTLELTSFPGDPKNTVYGNFDYLLLSHMVAKIHGVPTYEEALNALVLAPLHQTHTRGARSLLGDQQPGEARYHMRVYDPQHDWPLYPLEVLPSVRTQGQPLVASQYGYVDYEMFVGAGGLSSSIVDMARLAAMFSDRGANPVLDPPRIDTMLQACAKAGTTLRGPDGKPSHGYYGLDGVRVNDAANHSYTAGKGGWLPAQGTLFQFTTGGFTYVVAYNGNADVGIDLLTPVAAVAEPHAWPSTDLFSSVYGMPSLTGTRALFHIGAPQAPFRVTATQAMVKSSISQARAAYTHARLNVR
jgi:CubicO group peptidase (beta-lactamase class C family)